MTQVWFAIPGDLDTPTGGYGYDRQVMAKLPELGIDIRHLPLPGSFPFPSEADLEHMNRAWHRLDPWPDVREGLAKLKRNHIIAPCSNGNIALMVNLAKRAGLPWDCILGAETARAYKPMPEAYLASCRQLGLAPASVMMVAAHNPDLKAAKAQGLATAFVARPNEHGPGQTSDLAPDPACVDLAAADFVELAERLG